MNPNNTFDIQGGMGYNTDKDALYDEVIDTILSKPHIVKMDEQKAINDKECKHETLIAHPDDKIGEAIYHGCANTKCGRGWYIKPRE